MASSDRAAGIATRTLVVDGPLALRLRRLGAAREGEIGLQIVTLPQLAARLAGGFARPATSADLELAARDALGEGGLREIAPLAELPGMVRAVLRTFSRLWRAGIEAREHAESHPRMADLALLESRIRARLGLRARIAPDLVRLALQRRALFGHLSGEIVFQHVHNPAPVWRPLVEALAEAVPLAWRDCSAPDGWPGATPAAAVSDLPSAGVEIVSCAHPQAEVIEALRWARALIASGTAEPADIAIVAAAPEKWDDTFLGLSKSADLPVHFSHGIPALCTREGQACGALADLLLQGLSYGRVDRVLRHGGGRAPMLGQIPGQPLAGVPAGAALTTRDQWRRALSEASGRRVDGFDVAAALEPMLVLVAEGVGAAQKAGDQLLARPAAALWQAALRQAPASALPFTLAGLRMSDGKDPGANIVWGPAAHLAGAPRPWMRLLGMTSRDWPRPRRDDPLLPDHIFNIDPALSPARPYEDRLRFAALASGARDGLSLSFARRTPTGGSQAPSPLLPRGVTRRRLGRLRTPEHAYSESDRLQSRSKDGTDQARLARPAALARASRRPELTPWDGIVRSDHPLILETLAQEQSPSSLRQLLRDPQSFVWRYALGWHATLEEVRTLSLDDRDFGDLVHRLLQHTVELLESGPGFAQAAEHEVDDAVAAATARVLVEWPTQRPTPPPMLWRHTLDDAARLALNALRLDSFQPGTRSWTEVAFGEPESSGSLPWDPRSEAMIPGTTIRIRGRIDRVEIAAGDRHVRITDYKTGSAPRRPEDVILAGGRELQRVLYGVAARHHLPDAAIRAELVYLGDASPRRYRINDPDAAMADVARMLNDATKFVRRGLSLPGPDADESWNRYRLARPAVGEPVLKRPLIAAALRDLAWVWSTP